MANNTLKKIGIDFIDMGIVTIYYNYNVFSENSILDKKEQVRLHGNLFSFNGGAPIPTVFLVDGLGVGSTGVGIVQGRATDMGLNTMALKVTNTPVNVLLHELGHSVWSLEHPGCPCGYLNGIYINGQFNVNDKNNFMHGISNEITNPNIRRYQFNKIH